MRSVYLLMGLSALLSIAAIWAAYEGLYGLETKLNGVQFVAAGGFLAASAGWIFNNAISLRLKLRENSLDYLQAAMERIVLHERAAELNKHWLDLNLAAISDQEEELWNFWRANFPHHDIFKSLRQIGNSYELMGVTVKCGAVEEKMLRLYFASGLTWFYARLAPLLRFYRNDPPIPGNPRGPGPDPKSFSHVEWLAKRWAGREE